MSIHPFPKVGNMRATAVIIKCNFCDMTYGINHDYVQMGMLHEPVKHICCDCVRNGPELEGEDTMRIPCLQYGA